MDVSDLSVPFAVIVFLPDYTYSYPSFLSGVAVVYPMKEMTAIERSVTVFNILNNILNNIEFK